MEVVCISGDSSQKYASERGFHPGVPLVLRPRTSLTRPQPSTACAATRAGPPSDAPVGPPL